MKSITGVMLALALCALTVGAASAKVTTKTITFGADFWVGDTLVKKGTYKIAFDEGAGEIRFLDKQKNVVAKSAARVEKQDWSSNGWTIKLEPKGERATLMSLAFPADKRLIVLGDSTARADDSAVKPAN